MRIKPRVSTLASACLLSACAGHPPPVPLAGSLRDIAALTGEWTGDYSSDETGRSGSVTFMLTPRGDTAYGDVIMIPRGLGQPLRAWRKDDAGGPADPERSRPTTLTISFVRIQGNEVNGTLAPYRDPECGCALATRFVGWLRGDTISGSYFSSHERSEAEAHGRWQVVRKSARSSGP
ncbi:MAG TPA: hypothetical protein VIV88_09900 [Gemmatimonadales bacterium]